LSELKPGLHGEHTETVTEAMTAPQLGSGGVSAFGTPYMIAMMENAAVQTIDHLLEEGHMSVGIEVHVHHLKATPVGQQVRARAEVIAVEGRRVSLKVEAWDETQKIGEGTHQRAIIDLARFEAGLQKE
jgi:predicted thioesterase